MAEHAIYFDNLTPETQQKIRNQFNVNPEDQFWDLFPLLILRDSMETTEEKS